MSTPLARSPKAPVGTQAPTRQQLDELDALLQRMLDLPVSQEEEAEPPTPPPPPPARQEQVPVRERRQKSPAPTLAGSPTLPRVYPAAYMVVETNTPDLTRDPPRSEDTDVGLGPRIVSDEEPPGEEQDQPFESPVPGGRHDLESDDPVDPAEELARLAAELETPPEKWVPFQSSWQPSEQTWKPLAETWEQARTAPVPPSAPLPKTEPIHEPRGTRSPAPRPTLRDLPRAKASGPVVVTRTAQETEAPAPTVPRSFSPPPIHEPDVFTPSATAAPQKQAPSPAPEEPKRSAVLLPLVWFNVCFDGCLTLGGPVGDWLKGRGGRGFLGMVGLLCLAGAVALAVADGIGWTR